jgi:hypothetical protein
MRQILTLTASAQQTSVSMLTGADAPHSTDRLSASSLPYYVRAALSCVKTSLTSVLSPHLPDSRELVVGSSLRLLRISAGSHIPRP